MRIKTIERFKEIVGVLGAYGFGYIIDSKINKQNQSRSPRNLRKAFEELGPTFIKIGQILSTRPDIVPKRYIKELSKLQDNAPKEDFTDVKNIFYEEFKQKISEVFDYFNEKPLASASIAQVHEGILKDKRDVVVKIQRPNIKEKMELDISILTRIFKMTKVRFEDALINPLDALIEIKLSTEKELDFKQEKNNMKIFEKNNKKVACVYVPKVIEEFSSTKILMMEKINGIKITNKNKILEYGYNLDEIGKKLSLSYCKQIFDDGFFHGDPHPGNLLIGQGKICYLDFGLVGELTEAMKEYLNKVMFALATKDVDGVVDFLLSVGIKKGRVNKNMLYEDVQYMIQMYLSTSLKNIKISQVLQEIVELSQSNNIQLPRELTNLVRCMILLEGVVTEISPNIEIMDVIIPFVKNKTKSSLLKDVDKDNLLIGSYKFSKDTLKVPSKIAELSDTIINGRTKLNIQIQDISSSMKQLNKMVNRIVFGVMVASMIVGSSLVLNVGIGPQYRGISILGITGYLVAAIFGLWLMISIIRSGSLK